MPRQPTVKQKIKSVRKSNARVQKQISDLLTLQKVRDQQEKLDATLRNLRDEVSYKGY